MKTPANYRTPALTAHSTDSGAWLPTLAAMPRALDLSHWLSRAARGHTWNGHGASRGYAHVQQQRRRPN